ncbi:probable pectinesterase 56 [Gossypium hirsutum]|uniref:Probable pectinesterase 56 n=1 Tax=Gossypium hirsutum TaxID=3635 RepID=A0A1U8JVR7_GOSHI|nr:probable pectinesterase 56 [Gossypium hirsutum]
MVTARKHIMFIAILAVWWEGQGQLAPLFDMIIAQDESGDLITTTQGISSAPSFGSSRFRIKLCAGIYNENIVINKEKTNLTIIGEGMERGIITGSRSYGDGMKTFETATITARLEKKQAVALLTKASYPAFYKCRIIGFQDTLYAEKGY